MSKKCDHYDLKVETARQRRLLASTIRAVQACIAACCFFLSGVALAADPRPAQPPFMNTAPPTTIVSQGYHEHDGFFLHMHLGLGGLRAVSDELKVRTSGPGLGFGLSLGGAITRNLIVFGELELAVSKISSRPI